MHEPVDQLLSHLKAAWRYRWYAVVVTWLIALGGWIAVYLIPDRYEAHARVYVDTQSVLRPLLQGLAVQPNVDQMVTMMSRTLISVPNVEKVIRMADMDIGLKTAEDRQQLITRLTKELAIRSAGSENLYTISYADKNPETATRVVQSLLTLFVEGSLGSKRNDTDSARRFIDEQLEGYSEKLVAAENAVTEFKRRHLGLMPGEGRDYYGRLGEAKATLAQSELQLKEAENSRDSIKEQLASHSEIPSLLAEIPSLVEGKSAAEKEVHSEIDARIQALEQKLDDLRLSYTDQHPDIVAIVPMIARLREQKEAEAKLSREQKEAEAKLRGPAASTPPAADPVYQQLTVSLAAAEANVAAMKARVEEHRKRYFELQAAVNALPQVEAEYKQLTRDYEVNRARYDELLKRRESAQISGEMEASDAAMGFRVIDPPRVPLAPTSPKRPRLMSLVLLAALGGGLGVAFLISQIRPAFNDERRLREVSGLPVLGTVVMGWTDGQKARHTRGLAALVVSFLSLLSAYGVIMALLMVTVSRV